MMNSASRKRSLRSMEVVICGAAGLPSHRLSKYREEMFGYIAPPYDAYAKLPDWQIGVRLGWGRPPSPSRSTPTDVR